MKIKVLTTYGRRRVMHGAKILPGVYEHKDPALFGLADELLRTGVAVEVSEDATPYVRTPAVSTGQPVGLTHSEFEQATGRVAPEREEISLTTAPGGEVVVIDDSAPEPTEPLITDVMLNEGEADFFDRIRVEQQEDEPEPPATDKPKGKRGK